MIFVQYSACAAVDKISSDIYRPSALRGSCAVAELLVSRMRKAGTAEGIQTKFYMLTPLADLVSDIQIDSGVLEGEDAKFGLFL